jgi:hypothetical protein
VREEKEREEETGNRLLEKENSKQTETNGLRGRGRTGRKTRKRTREEERKKTTRGRAVRR